GTRLPPPRSKHGRTNVTGIALSVPIKNLPSPEEARQELPAGDVAERHPIRVVHQVLRLRAVLRQRGPLALQLVADGDVPAEVAQQVAQVPRALPQVMPQRPPAARLPRPGPVVPE